MVFALEASVDVEAFTNKFNFSYKGRVPLRAAGIKQEVRGTFLERK